MLRRVVIVVTSFEWSIATGNERKEGADPQSKKRVVGFGMSGLNAQKSVRRFELMAYQA